MTLFEYLAAGYVLILSLAVVRGISGVAYALRRSSRYGVHLAYLSIVLANCLVSFWVFWFFRDVEWTFYRFVATLAIPVLFYVHVSVLVPPDPSTVSSWQVHFFDVRTPLLGTGALFMGAVLGSNQALLGVSAFQLASLGPWTLLAICAIGASSAKPRLHTVLALGPPVLAVITILMLARPDSLASYAR